MRIRVKGVEEATNVVRTIADRRYEKGEHNWVTWFSSNTGYVLSTGPIEFYDGTTRELLGTFVYRPLQKEGEQCGLLEIRERKRKSLLPYLPENVKKEGWHIAGLTKLFGGKRG